MAGSNFIEHASFSGHESFALRYLWLKKGYDALADNPEFFQRDDAMVILGVGKNMVRSIRHWGLACQIWRDQSDSRGRYLQATELGHLMFADDGWDPFLEDIASSWWLHYQLVTCPDRATTWRWVFGRPKSNRFTRAQIVAELQDISRELVKKKPNARTITKDLDVLLRCYRAVGRKKGQPKSLEDELDSPLRALKLIRPDVEQTGFEIVAGPQPSLPTALVEAAIVDFVTQHDDGRRSVSLDALLYSPMSPGRTFRLSEDALVSRLMTIVREGFGHYVFDDTAGLRQLMLPSTLPKPIQILSRYYAQAKAKGAAA